MYDTWDITQDRQEDVDEEVCVAAALEEDAERWKEDGENDFADVAVEDNRISYTGPNKTQKICSISLKNGVGNYPTCVDAEHIHEAGDRGRRRLLPCGESHFDRK